MTKHGPNEMESTGTVVRWELVVRDSAGTRRTNHSNWDDGSFSFKDAVEKSKNDPELYAVLYAVQRSGRRIKTHERIGKWE